MEHKSARPDRRREPRRQSISRRGFLAGTSTVLAGTAAVTLQGAGASAGATPGARGAAGAAGAGRRRPNLVFIMADDLGIGELGCYGQRQIRTPTLDRMATEGIRFSGYYAGAPVCAPSRSVLLTGKHIGHAPVRENPPGPGPGTDLPLTPDVVTFGEVVRSAGYRTGLIGKWGFGPDRGGHDSHPNAQGFEEFFGHLVHGHAQEYYPTYLWDNSTRVELPENADGKQVTFAPDLFAARALDFVERHREEPFLLFWSVNLPHAPHQVPSTGPYENEPWPEHMKIHAAQVTHMDDQIGQLVAKLGELGLTDDTIVFFCSDNGPHEAGNPRLDPDFFDANGPLRGYKRNLYEGGIRAPMIAWSPARLRPAVRDHIWAGWDVLPTLATLAGAAPPADEEIDGLSMHRLLTGRPELAPEHEYLYWSRFNEDASPKADAEEGGRLANVADAVRFGRWKAIRIAPGTDRSAPDDQWDVELYDLRTDPGETTDISAARPRLTRRGVTYMKEAWTEPTTRIATPARAPAAPGQGASAED
jgi:arylsulfatase A